MTDPSARASTGADPGIHERLPSRPGLRQTFWAWRWFAVALCVVGGFIAWQLPRLIAGPLVAVDMARRDSLIESVVASGHIETPFRVEIGSQITGTVADVPVQEGQSVRRGQPLVLLEARELKAALEQAQGAVAQTEARLRQLVELTEPMARASLGEARANLLNAQQTFTRTSQLVRSGDATRVALDAAQKDLDVALSQLRTAELQVATAGPGGSDYVAAVTQRDQARSSRDTAASRLGYATIVAPRDGVLIARNVEQGTVAQPGKALMVLAPEGETQIVLQIDERNLGRIALGQKAEASADAYPRERFGAALSYISPGVDITRASVEVKLTVTQPPAFLRQDMTVSVDIETARRDGAIILPWRSVRDMVSDAPWAMVLRDGRAARVPVRVGLQGNTMVEILGGVSENEMVIPATATVTNGQRVRGVAP